MADQRPATRQCHTQHNRRCSSRHTTTKVSLVVAAHADIPCRSKDRSKAITCPVPIQCTSNVPCLAAILLI